MPCSPEERKAAGIFATAMGLGLMVGPGRHRTDDGEQEKRPRAGLGERGRRAGEEGGGGGASDARCGRSSRCSHHYDVRSY